jgi:hypothetical protein
VHCWYLRPASPVSVFAMASLDDGGGSGQDQESRITHYGIDGFRIVHVIDRSTLMAGARHGRDITAVSLCNTGTAGTLGSNPLLRSS